MLHGCGVHKFLLSSGQIYSRLAMQSYLFELGGVVTFQLCLADSSYHIGL